MRQALEEARVAKLAAEKAKQFFEEKSSRVETLAKQNKLIADNAAAAAKFREQFGVDVDAEHGSGAEHGELIEERDVLVDENGHIVSTLPPPSAAPAAAVAAPGAAPRAPSANSRRGNNNRLRHIRNSRRPSNDEWVINE